MSGDAVQRLESAIEAFAVPLRVGDGIDDLALDGLRRVLAELAERARGADTVPKPVAALLIELYPAVSGTAQLYEGEQAERVQAVSEELLELALACAADKD